MSRLLLHDNQVFTYIDIVNVMLKKYYFSVLGQLSYSIAIGIRPSPCFVRKIFYIFSSFFKKGVTNC